MRFRTREATNESASESASESMNRTNRTRRPHEQNHFIEDDLIAPIAPMNRLSILPLFALLLTLLSGAAGCVRNTDTTPDSLSIEALRARAAEQPNNAVVVGDWATAELLAEDGDPLSAYDALTQAAQLDARNPRWPLLLGIERYAHGAMEAAVGHFLDAIERAVIEEGTREVPYNNTRSQDLITHAAIAELAIGGLRELDSVAPRFPSAVQSRLEAAFPRLAPSAKVAAASLLVELALRRGDAQAARRVAEGAGCVQSWRVAGPIGPRDLLGFDSQHPIGGVGPMPSQVDLGIGRGTRPVRTIDAHGCAAHLGEGPLAEPGTTYAETFVDVAETGTYEVRLETPNSVELTIDGQLVTRLDARRHPMQRVTFYAAYLEAGQHEIEVKVTSRHPNPILGLSLLPSPIHALRTQGLQRREQPNQSFRPMRFFFPAPVERPTPSPPRRSTDHQPDPAAHLAQAVQGAMPCYLRASLALSRGHTTGARMLLADEAQCQPAPLTLALKAAVALSDPMTPASIGRDQARRALRQAEAQDPQMWFARLQLARLDAAEGQDQEAIAALRTYVESWPEILSFRLALTELLLARGWDAEAEAHIDAAITIAPESCVPLEIALGHARRRDRIARIDRFVEAATQCDRRSTARFALLSAARRWPEARAELDRLISLEPTSARTRFLSSQLDLVESSGTDASAIIEELATHRPRSAVSALHRVDHLMAQGDGSAALRSLDDALRAEPAALADLRRIRSALGGIDDIAPFRQDGAAIIEAFEASGESYEEPQLLLFDYTAVRVFEGGASLVLTHQIYRAQSEESVDELGQYMPEEGGYVLTLQTIKADGSRLEPDLIDGTGSINLPSVGVGDYVEIESVRVLDPPVGIPGGILGDRFYFANPETPFHHSELVVIAPTEMTIEEDRRGDAPTIARDTVEVNGETLQRVRWQADRVAALTFEPMSVNTREFVPSINWGVRATWPRFFAGRRDVLADRDPYDRAAHNLAQSIVQGAENQDQKAERLFRWVLANVENTADVFGIAPLMLASRTGNRARILYYLMRLLDLPVELTVVRSWTADQTSAPVADEDTYGNLVVRYDGGLLMTGARGTPFGYVSPLVQGQDGVVLLPYESPEEVVRFTVPRASEGSDRHHIEVVADPLVGGGAHLSIVETMMGSDAITWRENLEGISEATLNGRFQEAYVANLLPGAALTELRITGREDVRGPLVLRYEVDVPNFYLTRPTGSVVRPLFTANLTANYATLANRQTPQLVGPPVDLEIDLHLRHGATGPAQAPVTLEGPGDARFELRVQTSPGETHVHRHVRLPMMRIAPEDYETFNRWVQEVDRMEAMEIAVP